MCRSLLRLLAPCRPRAVGHPRAAWKTQNGTLGSRGFRGLSTGRTHSFAADTAPKPGPLLLPRPRGRYLMIRKLRAALRDVTAALGIPARIVPHQFRHTYGTEMLRAGVSFAAVMKLLGHKSPHMTLEYLEITQQDLQREFQLARSQPRHLAPQPKPAFATRRVGLDGLIDSLLAAQHVLEMFSRTLPNGASRNCLGRLSNR